MAYTAQEVSDYLAANPQLSAEEILSLAKAYDVGADVLYDAINVDGSQYQGVTYDQVAEAYQAAPVQDNHLAEAQAQAEARAQQEAQAAWEQEQAQAQAQAEYQYQQQQRQAQEFAQAQAQAEAQAQAAAQAEYEAQEQARLQAEYESQQRIQAQEQAQIQQQRAQAEAAAQQAQMEQAAQQQAQAVAEQQARAQQEAQAQASLGGTIAQAPAPQPEVTQQQNATVNDSGYTAQEVATFISANPQLTPDEILGLARSNNVGTDVLFDALNVDGGRFQGVSYNDVAQAYQAVPYAYEPAPEQVQPVAQDRAVIQPEAQAQASLGGIIPAAVIPEPQTAQTQQNQAGGNMAYTAQEVAAYIAANPQLSGADILALAKSNGVDAPVLYDAINVDGGRFQGVNYEQLASAYYDSPAVAPSPQPQSQPIDAAPIQNTTASVTAPVVAPVSQTQIKPISSTTIPASTATGLTTTNGQIQYTPGKITDAQLQTFFANNPGLPDSQVYAMMREYGVTPEQVSRSIGIPLDQAQTRFRDQRIQATPTGLVGAEESFEKGLADATGTLRGAEFQSRSDIDAALQKVVDLYGVNIDELRSAGSTATNQINAGFNEAQGYYQPFQQGGTTAFNQQMALSGALGQDSFNQANIESPYTAFLREQGMRANLAGAAATGGLGGGNVQKELQRFGQGLASQGLQQQFANLGSLSTMGMQGAQGLSGLATGRAGALGDITLNTAGNVTSQRTNIANAQGTAGLNRANIGQQTGQNIAQMQYGTGQDIGAGRTRAGELQAGQLQNAYLNQSNLLQNLGANQANLIGGQTADLINLQNDAATSAANLATGLSSNMSRLQTGLAQDQNAAYQGAERIDSPSFDYGAAIRNATNAAAGGYNLGNQAVYQTRQGGYAPVSESVPSYSRYGPYNSSSGGYSMPSAQSRMPNGVYNTQSMSYLGGLV